MADIKIAMHRRAGHIRCVKIVGKSGLPAPSSTCWTVLAKDEMFEVIFAPDPSPLLTI